METEHVASKEIPCLCNAQSLKQSVIVKVIVFPYEGGNPLMKCKSMWDPELTGNEFGRRQVG